MAKVTAWHKKLHIMEGGAHNWECSTGKNSIAGLTVSTTTQPWFQRTQERYIALQSNFQNGSELL